MLTKTSYGQRFCALASQLVLLIAWYHPGAYANENASQAATPSEQGDRAIQKVLDPNATEQSQQARPSIILESTSDGGFFVSTTGKLRNELILDKQYRLLRINGLCVKGQSLRDLKRMLVGPPGSMVDLTLLLTIFGELSVESLPRIMNEPSHRTMSRPESPDQSEVGSSLNLIEMSRYGRHTGMGERQQAPQSAAYEIARDCRFIAAASYVDLLNGQPMIYPKIATAEINLSLPDMLQFFYDNALFANVEAVAERCTKISESPAKLTPEELNALLRASKILMSNNQQKRATAIFTALLPSYRTMSIKNQALFLSIYGDSLRAGAPVDAAIPLVKELEEKAESWVDTSDYDDYLNQNKPADPLQVLANLYFSAGQYDKSIDCCKKLAKKQSPGFITRYSAVSAFTMMPPLIKTLRYQSQCYAAKLDFKSAVDTLKDAISMCQYQMNEEQQLLFEESATPSISDLNLDLAKFLLKSNDANAAHAVLRESLREIDDRLGSDSPVLFSTINLLMQIDESLHLNEEMQALQMRLDGLNSKYPQPSCMTDDDEQSTALRVNTRTAYDAILAHKYAYAKQIIKQLIDGEIAKKKCRDAFVTPIINLIKAYGQAAPGGDNLELLHDLDPLFVGSAATSANHVFQLTEIALSSKGAENSGEWKTVFDVLQKVIQEGRRFPKERTKDNVMMDWELMRRFKQLATVYACNRQPESAAKILEYAISRCNEQASAEPLLWLACFQVECGKFDLARQTMDLGLSRAVIEGDTLTEPILAICNAYQIAGHDNAAEQVLIAAIAHKKKQTLLTMNNDIETRLADLHQSRGRTAEALQVIEQSKAPQYRTRDNQYHAAAVFAASNQDDKALDLYLNQICTNIRDASGMEALKMALALLRKKSNIPPTTMSKFVADLASMYPGKVTESQASLLEQGLDWITSHNGSVKDIQTVKASLAQTYFALSKLESAEKIYCELGKQLEEKNPQASCSNWRDAARCLMIEKQYDQGCELMLHAMSLPGANNFYVPMYHPGNMRGDLGIFMLIAAGRQDLAEKILRKGIKLRTTSDAEPREPTIERLLLAEVLIDAEKYDETWLVLNELLDSVDKPGGELCKHCDKSSDIVSDCLIGVVNMFMQKKRSSDATRLAEKTIEMQQKWLGLKNPQLIDTLRCLGRLQRLSNERAAAVETLKHALDIACWNYGSKGRLVTFSRIDYAAALIAAGKKDEADKVAAYHPGRVKPLDSALLYGRRLMPHSRTPDRFVDSAEVPLKEQLKEYERLTGAGSQDTRNALRGLIDYYKQRQNWSECEILQVRSLETCELKEGRCSRQKRSLFLDLAETSLAHGANKKALDWLSKAESCDVTPGDWMDEMHESIQYASLLLKFDRKADAIKAAEKVFLKIRSQPTALRPSTKTLNECISFAHAAGLIEDEQFLIDWKSKQNGWGF